MKIRQNKIKALLSQIRADLKGYRDLAVEQYNLFRGLAPFYAISGKERQPLVLMAANTDTSVLSLGVYPVVGQEEKEIIISRAEEFSRKHEYTLRI